MSATVGDLTARLSVELDESGTIQKLRAQIQALEREPDPKIGLDTKLADTKLDQLLRRIESFARASAEVAIGANTTGAEQSVSRLGGILSRVARAQYTASVSADIDGAMAELRNMQAQLARLDDRPAHVEVRADTERAIAELQALRREMGMIENDTVEVSTRMAGMGGILAGVGSKAMALGAGFGVASAAMGILSKAFDFTQSAIIGTNMQVEEARATLLALTKDAGQTEDILSAMNKEAAKTPFTFGQISAAYVSLLPLTKQYRMGLQELVEVSELLAASNPQEGLEGAAFALREALSGDFTSLIERFNLSRAAINALREQGVPALEIIRQSMQGMGIDAELLARRADTTKAKWATFVDDLRLGLAKAGTPLFKGLGLGLDALIGAKGDVESVLHDLAEISKALADLPPISVIKLALEMAGPDWGWDLVRTAGWVTGVTPGVKAVHFVGDRAEDYNRFTDNRLAQQQSHANAQHAIGSPFQQFVDDHAYEEAYANQQVLYEAGERYFFQQQQLEAQLKRVREAEEATAKAQKARAEELETSTRRQYASDQLRRQNMETLDYVSSLSAQEQAAYNVSEAMSRLLVMQDRLADGYQVGLQIQQTYNAQSAEYESQASSIEKAMQLVQERQAQGIELTEQEIFIRDHGAAALERLRGGVEDATLTAGEYAIRNGELMTVQDELNRALAAGDLTQEQYTQKLQEAYAAAGLTYDATANNSTAMTLLSDSISTNLVPTLLDLIAKLDELNGKSVTTTVETKFITTGDPTNAQMFGYQSGSGYVGITAGGNAAGGYIDQPMLSLLGEEAPAHPEFVIPTNPARRGRALSLWMDAGHSLGVPGFADGGGPSGASGGAGGGGVAPTAIDWSFIFAGLDTEAEDYTERAAQAFVRFFGDIEALANGDALKSAQEKLNDLFTIRQIAIDSGAGEAVVAGIDAQIAAQQAQVNAIGQVMGSEVVAGMAAAMASAEAQQQVNESLKKTLMDLSSASDPYQKVQGLGQEVQDLKDAIAVAEAMGNMDVAAELRTELEAAQNEFLQAQNALTKMLKLGLLDDATIKEMAERGGEGFRQVYDTVFGEGALAALQDGWSRLSAEQFTQLQAFVGKGKDLSDQMVASILDGLTSGALSIEQAMQLLGDEQGKLAVSQQKQLAAQLEQTEQQLMQALASGDQARIATAQENYDALMELIQAYAAATGRTVDDIVGSWRRVDTTLRNAVSGQVIRVPNAGPPSMSSNGAFPAQSGFQTYATPAQTINLQLLEGKTIASWMMYDVAREVALTPSALGGIG